MECASNITEWLRELAKSPRGNKILPLLGDVVIFRDHYWECKPREEKEYEAWLTYDCRGVLRYREFYMGIAKGRSKVLKGAVQMVERLHPNYILPAFIRQLDLQLAQSDRNVLILFSSEGIIARQSYARTEFLSFRFGTQTL